MTDVADALRTVSNELWDEAKTNSVARRLMDAALRLESLPQGGGVTREDVAAIIDPEALSLDAQWDAALAKADAILALISPAHREAQPESDGGGKPANDQTGIMEVEVIETAPGHWLVEGVDHSSEGEVYRATFDGHDAETRARQYASQLARPTPEGQTEGAATEITADELHAILCSFDDRADVTEIAAKINAALASKGV